MNASEKLAQAAKLLTRSKALAAAARTQMEGAKKALKEADSLCEEARVLLAEVEGGWIKQLEGENA